MQLIDLLNKLLQEYFYEDTEEVDFSFLKNMTSIVRTPKFHLQKQSYHSHMRISRSFSLAKEFLTTVDPRYGEYLELLMTSGKIHIHPRVGKYLESLSCMIASEEDKQIEFYATDTIEDAYTFAHESMHSWNCREKNPTYNWELMTEGMSILIESLAEDYFRGKSLREYRKNKRDTYYALRIKAIALEFEIRLLEFYQLYRYLDEELLDQIFSGFPHTVEDILTRDLERIWEDKELQCYDLERNVIGGVLASYMHQRILEKPSRIGEFVELNDSLNELAFEDTLYYLGLEVLDVGTLELSKESQKQLQMSYQKELHRL